MANYDHIDCDFSWDGDFSVGDDGDVKDTSYDTIQSLINEIRNIIRSEIGDWELHALFASNLSDFIGEANSRETAKLIEERIISSLVSNNIVRIGDLQVRVVPVQNHVVMIIINVAAEATSTNSLVVGEPVTVSVVYDTLEDSIFFLPISEAERAAR